MQASSPLPSLLFQPHGHTRTLHKSARNPLIRTHTKRTAPGDWQERESGGRRPAVLSAQIWYGICNLFALKLELSSHPTATQESQHVRKKYTGMACARGWYNLAATKMQHAFKLRQLCVLLQRQQQRHPQGIGCFSVYTTTAILYLNPNPSAEHVIICYRPG